jgi:uncharacterized protein
LDRPPKRDTADERRLPVSVRSLIRARLDGLAGAMPCPFDVHAHTGADIDGTVRSSEEHVADLAAVGGRSVIFPLRVTTGYGPENKRVIVEAKRYPDRLVPFARLDPKVDSVAEAADALAEGARGFKLHPRAEEFRLEHPGVDRILAVAAEARAPVVICAGQGVRSFGPMLERLAARHRGCPIVLAHAGITDLAWLPTLIGDHPNLFFDTAWWNPADLLALFSQVPPEQILYGSDAPYGDVALKLVTTIRCGLAAGLSIAEVALVAGGRLAQLLDGVPAASARLGSPLDEV